MTNNQHHHRAQLIHELRDTIRDAEQGAALRAEARQWLIDTNLMRRERLAKLRDIRKDAREMISDPVRRIKLTGIVTRDMWPRPHRLHPEALYNEAGQLFAFSRTPLPGAPGCNGTYVMDDGYSLCGLADADCAAREDAREQAALLTMAALLLDHRITTTRGTT